MIKTLNGHKYAAAKVIFEENGTIKLKSYNTIVCVIDTNRFLSCTGLYSATTRKHIGWFLREYAPDVSYKLLKQLCEDKFAMNLDTWEVVDM